MCCGALSSLKTILQLPEPPQIEGVARFLVACPAQQHARVQQCVQVVLELAAQSICKACCGSVISRLANRTACHKLHGAEGSSAASCVTVDFIRCGGCSCSLPALHNRRGLGYWCITAGRHGMQAALITRTWLPACLREPLVLG
jgi:hypothetical protein